MNILITICIIVAFISCVALAVVMQRKNDEVHKAQAKQFIAESEKRDIQKTLDKTIKDIEGRIQRDMFEKIVQVEDAAHWLEGKVAEVLMVKRIAEEKYKEGENLAIWARNEMIKVQVREGNANKLWEDGKGAVKENKLELFRLQESALFLYDHYKKASDLLAKMTNEEIKYEEVYALLYTANHNRDYMFNYFFRQFGKTPEQYQEQKIHLSGKHTDGSEYISQFSKN